MRRTSRKRSSTSSENQRWLLSTQGRRSTTIVDNFQQGHDIKFQQVCQSVADMHTMHCVDYDQIWVRKKEHSWIMDMEIIQIAANVVQCHFHQYHDFRFSICHVKLGPKPFFVVAWNLKWLHHSGEWNEAQGNLLSRRRRAKSDMLGQTKMFCYIGQNWTKN